MSNFLADNSTEDGSMPDWLVAANNHNIGNTTGGSWFDPSTWVDKFQGAGKMISTGVLSGLNSYYNTGVTLGRWIGATDAEDRDTKEWIASFDDDLGQYYSENRQAADLLGFVAGSFVPGMGGIKILNAGQVALKVAADTGRLGSNLARATGLLVPRTEMYISAAAKDITQSMNIFSSLNANGVKALASGVGQNVLEGIAFETAVQATMFKSPVLENQDVGDILKNIAMGGLFQGVIGGAFSSAISYGKIRTLVKEEQARLLPLSSRTTVAAGTDNSSRIILNAEDLENAVMPIRGGGADYNEAAATALSADRTRRITNDIRNSFNNLAGSDNELGNLVADLQFGSTARDTMNTFLHTNELVRMKELTKVERRASALAKEGITDTSSGVYFVKLFGEDAGLVTGDAPAILSLADSVVPRANQSTRDAVFSEIKSYKFKLDDGFSTLGAVKSDTHLQAEARYLWAKYVLKDIPDDAIVHFTDLPVLQRALQDGKLGIKLRDDAGGILKDGFSSPKELFDYIIKTKEEVAATLIGKVNAPTEAIARIVDTKVSRLEGTLGEQAKDFFAMDDATQKFIKQRMDKGLLKGGDEFTAPQFLPSWTKVGYTVPEDFNGHVIDGLTYLKTQQKIFQAAANNVTAQRLGKYDSLIPIISDADLATANTTGSGASLFGFENSSYGTLGSKMAGIGSVTREVKQSFRQTTQDALEGPLALLAKNKEAAIEHHTISQKITRSADLWVLDEEGNQLVKRNQWEALNAGKIDELAPEDILPIVNEETFKVIQSEIERSSDRISATSEVNAVLGRQTNRDPLVYQPTRPSLTDYPYFAFVKDDRVTGSGHTTLIHAATQDKLDSLVNSVKLKNPELRVITKNEAEDYFKARHEYEYDRGLNENYLNSELKNKGIFSEYFTKTDPIKIANDILQQHLRQDDALGVELVRLKNQPAFDWLEDQGKQFTKIEASKFGSSLSKIEKEGKNPYTDYIKTALDVSKASEHPLLYGINKSLDGAVSRVMDKVNDVWNKAKTPEEMLEINSILQNYGMDSAYRNAATDLLVNHSAPKGTLTKFIRGANAILSKLTLGLDPLNAVNNFIGANILRGTELNQITNAIANGDSRIVGKLAELSRTSIPGTGDSILAPAKLVAKAVRNFIQDDGTLLESYKNAGYIKDISKQFKSILDDFTLQGTESVGELEGRLRTAFDKAKLITERGEKLTGNKFTEEFNRFVSADVMRQITDLGKEAGFLNDAEAHSYINTFVNRVEGNTVASQRPIIFQGPIGQAVGLFQSYQFNLMQQMFRYVAEGTKKDAAMLLGLQSTFYGLQGLPAFQFINQHVVGTLSGNTNHTDLYDATLGIAGKQAGEFLLYGFPSKMLQTNLYSRGDINPRQVTVIPTTPAEVPFIGAFGKFLGSMAETAKKIGNGAPVWESFLQGLEHNGISRPLAGLAQTMQAFGGTGQAFATSSKGTILTSNDLASWATLVRLSGGRPLDEAVVNDAMFRIHSYSKYNHDKMNDLAESVKASVIAGQSPSPDTVASFASEFAARGGKQIQFNKWMMNQYKNANTSEAQRIAAQLSNPLAVKAQMLMGGESFGD